jgi:hypothetical protein
MAETLDVLPWLESIKKGYGSKFASSFEQLGVEDTGDVPTLSAETLVKLEAKLIDAGAKEAHVDKIKAAIAALVNVTAGVVPHRPADPSSSSRLSRHGDPDDKTSNPSTEVQKATPMKSGKQYACFLRCACHALNNLARASIVVIAAYDVLPFSTPKSSQGLVRNGSAFLKGEDGDDAERAVLPRF